MIARRYAAGDLQIDHTVLDVVASRHPAHDQAQSARGHGRRDLKLRKRSPEARQMPFFVDQPAAMNGDHLIDPVGELIAPVFYIDASIGHGPIASVDVCDARHPVAFLKIFQLHGEHLFHFVDQFLGGEKDHPVLGLDDHAAARRDDIVAADHRADANTGGQLDLR